MSLVLDASATMAWIYSERSTPFIVSIFQQVIESGAWVPALWHLEVANVLEMGRRRGRHDAAFRAATLADFALLPIYVDTDTPKTAWGETLRLAERHHLTLYDAAYLELALKRGLPLASLDRELQRAAVAEAVPLLGNIEPA